MMKTSREMLASRRPRNSTHRALLAAGMLMLLVLAGILILLLSPECLILKRTGFYCVGCGTQRMVHALLRGDFAAAVRLNPFMLFALPAGSIYVLLEAWRFVAGKRALWRGRWFLPAAFVVMVLATAFVFARNIPGSPLAPP